MECYGLDERGDATLYAEACRRHRLYNHHIAEAGNPGAVLLSPPLNLHVYALLSILLFDWAARRMKGPYPTAFVIGAAQHILVMDLTLREWETG